MKRYPLSESIGEALIIAYKEDTQRLESCLTAQGFACSVIRQQHQAKYKDFSPSYLCLLNHCEAWKVASAAEQPTLIVEADFVPVKNLGKLPVPFDLEWPNVGLAWLYTCAPQIYTVTETDHAIGFSTSMVAYIITPLAAQKLQTLVQQITKHPGPTQYSSWDSSIEEFLRKQKLDCFVPWRNYGEHGGRPNGEHKKAGLSAAHRADVLYGSLAFDPVFVETCSIPKLRLFLARLKARAKGLARLVCGKYLRWKVLTESSTPLRLCKFAAGRHLTLLL